jgi:hypothetical protein
MPLLPLVGLRRRLGASQRVLAPELTRSWASVRATSRMVSSDESLIQPMYQSGEALAVNYSLFPLACMCIRRTGRAPIHPERRSVPLTTYSDTIQDMATSGLARSRARVAD